MQDRKPVPGGGIISSKADLIEGLIIRGEQDDFKTAKTLLDQSGPRDLSSDLLTGRERPEIAEEAQGKLRLLRLLLAIAAKQDDKDLGNQWCDWLQNGRLHAWYWAIWNWDFPTERYSDLQNAKFRAIQLSAKGAVDAETLRKYFK